ncbi:MAG: mechanosensitive ion channel [Rhodospirillales bacterium]|nr:mechanosensitive ion channel [Rhodospirillales bacterium]
MVFGRLILPGITFLVIFLLHVNSAALFGGFANTAADGVSALRTGFAIASWISGAFLVNRLINSLFWGSLVARSSGASIPGLVTQLSSIIVYLLALTGIVGWVFDKSVTGLLTTSGALGLLLGFALRSLILDLFSGISVNLERSFVVGEYIYVQVRGASGLFGRVEEMTWRTTRLLTPDNSIQIIPNSTMGTSVITNYSRPSPVSEFEQVITLDVSIPSERALSILDAALKEAVLIGGPLEKPESKVRTSAINEDGITYKLKYFIDPRKGGPGKVRQIVLETMIAHLARAGIQPAGPKRELVYVSSDPVAKSQDNVLLGILKAGPLFTEIDDNILTELIQRSPLKSVEAGEVVLTQGDKTKGIYIVCEGIFEYRKAVPDSKSMVPVGYAASGDFFGEPARICKSAQSVSVIALTRSRVLEIPDKDLSHCSKPLSVHLSARVQRQSEALAAHIEDLKNAGKNQGRRQMFAELASQISSFFQTGVVGRVANSYRQMTGMPSHDDLLKAAMAACALVAAADGEVDKSERDHVKSGLESLGLFKHMDGDDGMAQFDANTQQLSDGDRETADKLLDVVSLIKSDENAARLVLSISRALSSADGLIDEEEEFLIGKIAAALNLGDTHKGHWDMKLEVN